MIWPAEHRGVCPRPPSTTATPLLPARCDAAAVHAAQYNAVMARIGAPPRVYVARAGAVRRSHSITTPSGRASPLSRNMPPRSAAAGVLPDLSAAAPTLIAVYTHKGGTRRGTRRRPGGHRFAARSGPQALRQPALPHRGVFHDPQSGARPIALGRLRRYARATPAAAQPLTAGWPPLLCSTKAALFMHSLSLFQG